MGNYSTKDVSETQNGRLPQDTKANASGAAPVQPSAYSPVPSIDKRAPVQQQYTAAPTAATSLTLSPEESVATVFRWEHGGKSVFIAGTFNNWESPIPMHRSGNDFTYVANLRRVSASIVSRHAASPHDMSGFAGPTRVQVFGGQ